MKYMLLLLTTLITLSVSAQQFLLSTAGNSATNSESSISWSLGELATSTYSANGVTLTQGFQQPTLQVSTLIEEPDQVANIKVYPNPVAYQLTVDLTENKTETYKLALYNMQGKLLKVQTLEGTHATFNFRDLASGQYLLKISAENRLLKTYKVVKQ